MRLYKNTTKWADFAALMVSPIDNSFRICRWGEISNLREFRRKDALFYKAKIKRIPLTNAIKGFLTIEDDYVCNYYFPDFNFYNYLYSFINYTFLRYVSEFNRLKREYQADIFEILEASHPKWFVKFLLKYFSRGEICEYLKNNRISLSNWNNLLMRSSGYTKLEYFIDFKKLMYERYQLSLKNELPEVEFVLLSEDKKKKNKDDDYLKELISSFDDHIMKYKSNFRASNYYGDFYNSYDSANSSWVGYNPSMPFTLDSVTTYVNVNDLL